MSGFLLVNKPGDITSFGAVKRIKYLAHEKRVGHTGTLDPMATGVLPVFIGRATVLSNYLLTAKKEYIATVRLGLITDTLDITGKVIKENAVSLNNKQVLSALNNFVGNISQVPPQYSAIKKNGVRAYDLARNGTEVQLEPRDITVYSIEQLKELDQNFEFSFKTVVSKGTYIRSLVRDIGEFLGCGAVLTELVRTNTAGFSIENCVALEDLNEDNISKFILPPEKALIGFDDLYVTDLQAVRFANGGALSLDRIKINNPENEKIFKVFGKNKFIGLGIVDTKNQQLSVKCIVDNEL